MLITRTTLRSGAAALILAASLAGCGDSGDDTQATATSTSPAATSPPAADLATSPESKPAGKGETAWANKLCTALVGRVSAIEPPSVAASTPEATLKSLTTFFTNVVEEQGSQLKTIEDVGPPPSSKAEKEWQKAVDELRTVRKDVSGVVDGLEESTATSEADVTKLIASLQKQLQSLGAYEGPVKSLAAGTEVGAAMSAEPACQKVA